MSLDIYLEGDLIEEDCECPTCDFVHKRLYQEDLGHVNITHNLCKMAQACHIYEYLWRQEETEIVFASQLIPRLENSLGWLAEDPIAFKRLNPENGWGTYDGFMTALRKLLQMCKEHPEAKIRTNR
jgi:hypothetical protein